MKALTYLLRLKAPLLATQVDSGEPNSATTQAFIPGSVVRGAIIRRLPATVRHTLEQDERLAPIYLGGAACFLNAYPADPVTETRLLPVPRSWRVDKSDTKDCTATITDFALGVDLAIATPKLPAAGEFVGLSDNTARLYSPQRQIVVHNASTDRNQKAAGVSTVYRYESLAAGEVFAGAIVGTDEALLEIQPWLSGEFLLGGSRTGGYGLTAIEQVELRDWMEYEAGPGPRPDGRVVVTLLSDAILRGSDGAHTADPSAALGSQAAPLTAFVGQLRVVGGFNRAWGLPLTQAWAIPAGSVFVYAAQAVDVAALVKVAEAGIGERRAEGFGRLAINWQTRPSWPQASLARRSTPATALPLTAEAKKLASRMAGRQLQAWLDAKLVELVAQANITRADQARPSQLSRVRVAARQALFEQRLKPIADHVTSLYDDKGREKVGARQLSDVRVNGAPLMQWLRARIDKPDLRADFQVASAGLRGVAGQQAEIGDALQAEYLARLIDGVVKKAVKLAQKAQQRTAAGGSR